MLETIIKKAIRRKNEGKSIAEVVVGPLAFKHICSETYARTQTVLRAELPVVPRTYESERPDMVEALRIQLFVAGQNVDVFCDEFLGDMQTHWVEPVAVVAAPEVAAPAADTEPVLVALGPSDSEPDPVPEPASSPETPDALADTEPAESTEPPPASTEDSLDWTDDAPVSVG